MPKQYISVSGVTKLKDIEALERHQQIEGNIDLLLGVQATYKTQFQKLENSRGAFWHPVGNEIWDSFIRRQKSLAKRVIHYSYPTELAVDGVEAATQELMDRLPTDATIDGWQFNNLAWDQEDFSGLVARLSELVGSDYLIAQLSGKVLVRSDSIELARRIAGQGIAHVLFDSSGGTGQSFDYDNYRRYIESFIEYAPGVHLGIAGGMGPDQIEPYEKLLKEYPSLSCDAEYKLRDFPDEGVLKTSIINIEKAAKYIEQSKSAIAGSQANFKEWWQTFEGHLPAELIDKLLKLHLDYWRLISTAPGSSHNHQAWKGGYIEHITQVIDIAKELYEIYTVRRSLVDLSSSNEHFTLEDAILVLLIHDIEKPFKSTHAQHLRTKEQRNTFKCELLAKYDIKLSEQQQQGLDYVEGFRDNYSPKKRAMSPLGAFVHACDLLSARLSYNVGNPGSKRSEL